MTTLIIASLVLLGQLATKTGVYFALLSTCALIFGLLAIGEGGGFRSAAGFLNAVMVGKFLLIAFVLKLLTFQPADQNLGSANSTATVMALGFLGLLIGTWIHRRLPTPSVALIPAVNNANMYLSLTIVMAVASYGGFFLGLAPDLSGEGVQTGGILGIARNVSLFRSLPIIAALYFAWSRGGKRFMTHPLVLTVLTISIIFGIFSTGKQDAMEPLLFYVAISASRYGVRDKRLWLLTFAGIAYYALLIYPYSQYVRSKGGREGDLQTRVKVMGDVFWLQLTDPNFREYTKAQTESKSVVYLGEEKLEPFSRLAMIGEADKLITATNDKSHTGWETITWGLSLIAPSFLFPDKQIVPAGNYLGHVAGEADPSDELTQFSYGEMANFYNAFGYWGTFVGSILFYCVFYYLFRFWFKDPRWTASPKGTTMWFLVLVAFYQHALIEESFSGILSRMTMPIILLALYTVSKYFSLLLPTFQDNGSAGDKGTNEEAGRGRVPINSVPLWNLATPAHGKLRTPNNGSSNQR